MNAAPMKLLSLNVGEPRDVEWRGQTIRTAIYKAPAEGRLELRGVNLAGDDQADRRVHGGRDKAVYAYPHEHYAFWKGELPDYEFTMGNFGENLTTQGLLEDQVNIGDEYRIGSAVLTVTQPRMPCAKLGLRFERDDMVKRFMNSRRPGIYFSVRSEGHMGAGDEIEKVHEDPHGVTVLDVLALAVFDKKNEEGLARALMVPALASGWRDDFEDRLRKLRME